MYTSMTISKWYLPCDVVISYVISNCRQNTVLYIAHSIIMIHSEHWMYTYKFQTKVFRTSSHFFFTVEPNDLLNSYNSHKISEKYR